ncbi:MAG: hypothetical protein D6730_24810 [Bacteroidetes bacterium]|nr:MAG: hypothetical protein D6730_24810 [Bacteroidota bacterium]
MLFFDIRSMKLELYRFPTVLLLLIAWTFISILGGIETLMIYLIRPDAIQFDKFYWIAIMRIVNGFAAILMVLYPGYKLLKNQSLTIKIIGYIIFMFLFILVYLAFSVGQFQLMFLKVSWNLFIGGMVETLMTELHHIASYYFFLLFIMIGKDYYEERTNVLLSKNRLETELTKTQLEVLQRQIQPHFLFNTLNNVVAIIDEKKKAAQEMLIDLSELLRVSMDMDFSTKIALSEELNILNKYLSIEKKRFEHQLNYQLNIREADLNIKLPPFLLQPLVENAIKHGFKDNTKSLYIVIESERMGEMVHIKIKNNGTSLSSMNEGLGIRNVKERLTNSFENAQYRIYQKNEWVINEISLPL